jgi:prepilin-type N-terminal cleavage/methylation domain-containing protein
MSRGFTLIELLVYVAIFAIVAGIFSGILVVALRVQSQQTGLVEVNNQLNFVMQTIQRLVRESSTIDSPSPGASASTLNLTRAGSTTIISLGTCGTPAVANAVCVQEGGGANLPITTAKVVVPSLSFSHFITPSNHPSFPDTHTVQIAITMDFNTTHPQQAVSRTLQSSASPLK